MAGLPKFSDFGDKQALEEAGRQVAAGVEAALDPKVFSSALNSVKEISTAGNAVFKFFGTADSLNELRKLLRYEWKSMRGQPIAQADEDTYGHLGTGTKLGAGLLYLAHATMTAMLGAAVLGAAVIAAPILTTIVSAIGFVKNIGEAIRAQFDVINLEGKVSNGKDRLQKKNIDFQNHIQLHNDISQSLGEINTLKQESSALQKQIDQLDKAIKKSQNKASDKDDPKIAKFLREEHADLSRRANKNQAIADKTKKFASESPATLAAHYDIKLKEAKIQLIDAKRLNDPAKVSKLEAKIEKYEVLKSHFNKIDALVQTKTELEKDLKNLDAKYSKGKYKNGSESEKLKELERTYLIEQIQVVQAKIDHKTSVESRQGKADRLGNENQSLPTQGPGAAEKLRAHLLTQKEKVDNKVQAKQQVLDSKQKYIALFSDPNKPFLQSQAKEIFKESVHQIENENKLKISKMERERKVKNALFAGVGLALSIVAIVVWPIAAAVGAAAIVVGVAAGISNLRDRYRKNKLEKELDKSKDQYLSKLSKDLDKQLDTSAQLQREAAQQPSDQLKDRLQDLLHLNNGQEHRAELTDNGMHQRSRSMHTMHQGVARVDSPEAFLGKPKKEQAADQASSTSPRKNSF